MCPAVMGKVRCPAKPESMKLPFSRAQVHKPPEHLPRCCVQQTITVSVEINAKTSQKHDYPSKAHRNSFARRTGAERGYSTLKDQRVHRHHSWLVQGHGTVRSDDLAVRAQWWSETCASQTPTTSGSRRTRGAAKAGLPPRTRKRRRRTLEDLVRKSGRGVIVASRASRPSEP